MTEPSSEDLQWQGPSLLRPLCYNSGSCGYCHSENTAGSYYAQSNTMSVETYQAMVDRGWRRSGTVFYKPDLLRSCCPHYTIRLPTASFKASRDQRKALNRWNRHVLGEEYLSEVAKRFPLSKTEKARQQKEGYDLVKSVHEAEGAYLRPVEPARRFEVSLERDTFTEEKFQLYRNYQSHVHKDPESKITKSGFRRFLCESPLLRKKVPLNGKGQLLGSYHQCYRLDGRLVAMGVLDLLPHAVSGVYLLYHSDFEKFSFGKLSALTELALAVEGGYQFYYMGYYIHSCTKMRYKGDYKPQQVMDPMSYRWHLLDDFKAKLDENNLVSLDEQIPAWQYTSPSELEDSGDSLITTGMPGLPTEDQLKQQIKLGEMSIYFGTNRLFRTLHLRAWHDEPDMASANSIRGMIGDLAACLGPEAVESGIAVDFSKG